MITDLSDVNKRLKYLEDTLNAVSRKQFQFEAQHSEFVERLGALEHRINEEVSKQSTFAYQMGEFHGGYVNQLSEIKVFISEINRQLGSIQDDFNKHLINHHQGH